MHTYASDSIDRRMAPWILAVIAVFIAYTYVIISKKLEFALPWWCEAPSIIGAYGLLHWVYDSILWKKRIFSFRLSQIPDCNGTWYGKLNSSHNSGTAIEGMLRIYQTWRNICIEFHAESSHSYSRMAALNISPGKTGGLSYEYDNEPRVDATDTMHAHRGFVFLKLSRDKNYLTGDYYTGRDRLNMGTMRLIRVSQSHLDLREAQKEYVRIESIGSEYAK